MDYSAYATSELIHEAFKQNTRPIIGISNACIVCDYRGYWLFEMNASEYYSALTYVVCWLDKESSLFKELWQRQNKNKEAKQLYLCAYFELKHNG